MFGSRSVGLALAFLLLATSAFAQTGTLTGRVLDAQTADPIVGVAVILDGTTIGATTDLDGNYRISDVTAGESVIVARALGYTLARQTVVVQAGQTTTADFRLQPARLGLGDVVVSAARRGAIVTSIPAKVTVIGTAEVRDQQLFVSNPNELLANSIPSFAPSRQKLTGFGESFRGRSPLYLIDGIPQSNPLRNGSRDGFTIDPEVVDRVEVIFGANAAQGLGATGGIVNYVTVNPEPGEALTQRISLSTTAASEFNDDGFGYRAHYLASKRFGDLAVVASANLERRGLLFDGEGRTIGIDNTQGDIADSFSRNLFGKVEWRPAPSQRIQLLVNDFRLGQTDGFVPVTGNREEGLPTTSERGEQPGDLPVNDVTTAALDYEHGALGGGALSAKIYVQDFASLFGGGVFGVFQDPAIAPAGELFEQSENNSEKIGARLTYSRPAIASLPVGVVAGLDLLRGETFQRLAQTDRNWVPVTRFNNAAPFVQLDVPVADILSVSGGVRWEFAALDVPDYVSIAGNRRDSDFQPTPVTGGSPSFDEPLFNVGLSVTPIENVRLYGSVAQAFTMPDVGRVLRGVNVPGVTIDNLLAISPVLTDNYEAGASVGSDLGSFGVTAFLSESDFGARLVANEDGIFEVRREPTRTSGFELTGRIVPTEQVVIGAALSSLTGRFDSDDNGDFDSDLDAINIGPDRLNLSVDLDGRIVRGRLQSFTYFDKTFEDIDGNETAAFEGFTTVDASVGSTFGPATVTLAIANLLDEQYITYYSQAGTGRDDRFYAGRGRAITLRLTADL
ncbi:MAG: TonB-dependent receptor [Bacteroidota bacterium]